MAENISVNLNQKSENDVDRYCILQKATLDANFFKSNRTTNIFNAIAEIIDNSKDATAKNFNINYVKNHDVYGGWYISFLDDGEGMDPVECIDVTKFGNSKKRTSNNYVGRNGVGLKTASFRLANDMILFTKKHDIFTIMFWSQTFYKALNLHDVIVAIPSFTEDKSPYYDSSKLVNEKSKIKEKHNLEMELIHKYSPFKNIDEIFAQFNKIKSKTGTLIYCFNLWLTSEGKTEFSIDPAKKDLILMGDAIDNSDIKDLEPQKRSFREYASILYKEPKMKIYIDGLKVRTKNLLYSLHFPYEYKYLSKNIFKRKTEISLEQLRIELKDAKTSLMDARSRENHQKKNYIGYDRARAANIRLLQGDVAKYTYIISQKEAQIKELEKKGKDAQLITFQFGINVHKPSQDGVFIYHGCRLISTPEKLTQEFFKNFESKGIAAILTIPYSVMEPSQYKSDGFKIGLEKEILKLKKALVDHFESYLTNFKEYSKRELKVDLKQFWDVFGYDFDNDLSHHLPLDPAKLESYYKQRFMRTKVLVQCDICLKWRAMTHDKRFHNNTFEDNWCCHDLGKILIGLSCDTPEKIEIRVGEGHLNPRQPKLIEQHQKRNTICVERDIELVKTPLIQRQSFETEVRRHSDQLNHGLFLKPYNNSTIGINKNLNQSITRVRSNSSVQSFENSVLNPFNDSTIEINKTVNKSKSDTSLITNILKNSNIEINKSRSDTSLPTTSQNISKTLSLTEFLQISTANKAKRDELPPSPPPIAPEVLSNSNSSDDFNYHELFNDNLPSISRATSTNIKKKRKRVDDDDRLYRPSKYLSFNSKNPKTDTLNLSTVVRISDDDENDGQTPNQVDNQDVQNYSMFINQLNFEMNGSRSNINSPILENLINDTGLLINDDNGLTQISDKYRKILNETKTDQQDFFFFSNQQLIEYDENEHLNKFIDEIKEKESEKSRNIIENLKAQIQQFEFDSEKAKRELKDKDERIEKLIQKNCGLENKLNR